jgi:hypothetical protein
MRYHILVASLAAFSVLQTTQVGQARTAAPLPQERQPGATAPPEVEDVHVVPRTERERLRALQHLIQMHTLREVAAANGGHFEMQHNVNTESKASDLSMLGQASDLVIVGRPTTARVQLSPNGKMIYTYYEVAIDETLKGARPGRTVVVKIPGGKVTFDDGSVAEIVTPNFEIHLDAKYVLFLQPTRTGIGTNPADIQQDVRVPSLGSQGIFDVSTGQVTSMALPNDPLRLQHQGRNADSFVVLARTAAVGGLR